MGHNDTWDVLQGDVQTLDISFCDVLLRYVQGGHVSGFFNYRVSRNYPRKCSQLRVITRNYEGSKCTQKFEITMSQYA